MPKTKQNRGPGFTCIFCNRYFNGTCDQRIHIRRHIKEKPYNCAHCDFTAVCSTDINCHVENIHSNQKFLCSLCPQIFPSKRRLAYHWKHFHLKMESMPGFTCDICGKTFKQSGNLKAHRRIHTGETPFQCEFCTKAFAQKSTLTQHLRSHRGERRFRCQVCGKGFFTKQHQKMHDDKWKGQCVPPPGGWNEKEGILQKQTVKVKLGRKPEVEVEVTRAINTEPEEMVEAKIEPDEVTTEDIYDLVKDLYGKRP